MINEGAKILEEEKAIRASDIDVVWLNGYGWPVYRGGPMYYGEQIGLDKVLDKMKEFQSKMGDAVQAVRAAGKARRGGQEVQTRARLKALSPRKPLRLTGARRVGENRRYAIILREPVGLDDDVRLRLFASRAGKIGVESRTIDRRAVPGRRAVPIDTQCHHRPRRDRFARTRADLDSMSLHRQSDDQQGQQHQHYVNQWCGVDVGDNVAGLDRMVVAMCSSQDGTQ